MGAFKKFAAFSAGVDILNGKQWEKYAKDKPFSPNPDDYEWDPETGMPIGLTRLPEGDAAIRFQQRSNEIVARRNASLRRQAMTYLELGQRSMANFRPGGYANDSYFREMSQLSMGSQIDAPDLMGGDRAFAMKNAQQAQDFAASRAAVQNVASVVASLYTGGAGAALTRTASPNDPRTRYDSPSDPNFIGPRPRYE